MPSIETLEDLSLELKKTPTWRQSRSSMPENSSMQENQLPPRIGRALHLAAERVVLAKAKSLSSTCVRPVLVKGDVVVIRWIFVFVWNNDSVTRMEEVAYQRWDGDRIVEEQFFYDPAQLIPKAH